MCGCTGNQSRYKRSCIFCSGETWLNEKIFNIYKFRSMVTNNKKSAENKLYENDTRITRVGHFIRKTSIDELPQLFNILNGDMSFIGPRPPVPYFPKRIEEYSSFERQRFLVKPGISGLAQVRCRQIHDWDINIPIDVEYVQNFSFANDLRLFIASLSFFFNPITFTEKNKLFCNCVNEFSDKGHRIIAVHQPNYLPWLGYFFKIFQSDIFVFLDDAQFSNEGMHNYTYIKTAAGLFRLKYPVEHIFFGIKSIRFALKMN